MLRMMIRFMLLPRTRELIMYDIVVHFIMLLYPDNPSSRNLRWQIGIAVF